MNSCDEQHMRKKGFFRLIVWEVSVHSLLALLLWIYGSTVCHSRKTVMGSVHLMVDKKQERSEGVRGPDIPLKGITPTDLISLYQAPLL